MRNLGINLAVGIVAAYIAYQLGAWRERVFFIGLEERSQQFRKTLKELPRKPYSHLSN